MQRALLASALVLGLAVIGLAAAAFVAPPEDLVEPSNAKLNFGHETTYDSFAPIHYPEHGIFVLRHQSWRMLVYLDRDPTSGCLLEWVPAEEVALVLGGGRIRWPATEGVFHDPVLGTYYSPEGEAIRGPGRKPLTLVEHTMPYNTVEVIEGDIWEAEPFRAQRLCSD